MNSMLESTALEEFIAVAEMDEDGFEVQRTNNQAEQSEQIVVEATKVPNQQTMATTGFQQRQLVIPRKPKWDYNMTAEEVDRNEKIAFLAWRRCIADLENIGSSSNKITPFEKNLEVWRQLWRVSERSDLVIQVVDGRNPLLFYTEDLKKYLSEFEPKKKMILLVNKADLLSDQQRNSWATYFHDHQIKFLFYSAHDEQKKLDGNVAVNEDPYLEQVDDYLDYLLQDSSECLIDMKKVITRIQLIQILSLAAEKILVNTHLDRKSKSAVIGMVGYPNVGKSSVINTLLGVSKSNHGKVRVGVSSTPGKTKHFQTIVLSESITICDCPGLVFPSFMNSTGEMLCSGILPINQMRDCMEPANIIASRIPQHLLEATYGIKVIRVLDFLDNQNRPPTGEEFLAAYCKVKGYITSKTGRWDDFRACKEILRDFNDGILLYVALPPSEDGDFAPNLLRTWIKETEETVSRLGKISDRLKAIKHSESIDENRADVEIHDDEEDLENYETADADLGGEMYEFISGETDTTEQLSISAPENSAKREHKRLKNWGKKNRKLRDKTPYDDNHGPQSYGAFFKNRNLSTNIAASIQSDRS